MTQPEWAREIAKARWREGFQKANNTDYPFYPSDWLVDLLAEMIVKTELPPVDPDELFVCNFLNSFYTINGVSRGWSLEKTKAMTLTAFNNALTFYKASKAEKKGPGDGPSR